MSDVLEGVKVIEVASWTFVPAAGAILADWGADVIKVEDPVAGDPQRGLLNAGHMGAAAPPPVNFMMEQPNRGKRSVGINIASPEGLELLYRLVADADVFLTNFLPGLRQRLKIDVEHIQAINPNVVYARGTGHGVRGPESSKAGFDATTYFARSGMALVLTPEEREWPIGSRPAMGDSPSGAMLAGGIAGALFRRERTGHGAVVDVSLLGCAMWAISADIVGSKFVGKMMVFDREDAPNPLVNQYRTSDDRVFQLIMLQSDRFWPEVCKAFGREDLIDDPRFATGADRNANRRECIKVLDGIFATKTLDECRQALADSEAVWDIYHTPAEVFDDPQAIANGYFHQLATGDGDPFTLVANPVQVDEQPDVIRGAPAHGESTDEVLLALGLSWDELIAHKVAGVVL